VQLAVELVLTSAFTRSENVNVTLVGDGGELSIAISPVAASMLADTRAGYDGESRIALRTLLERLVDVVADEPGPAPAIVLRKAIEASRP
jgi:hypothetical protein